MTFTWLEVPKAPGDEPSLRAAALVWGDAGSDLHQTAGRLGSANSGIAARWSGTGQLTFLSAASGTTAHLVGLTDVHARGAQALSTYATALSEAQPVADRSVQSIDDGLVTYASEALAAADQLATATGTTVPTDYRALPAGLSAQTVAADGSADAVSVDQVTRDLAGTDWWTTATATAETSSTDSGVQAAIAQVQLVRSRAATTIATAYNAAVTAADAWHQDASSFSTTLVSLTTEVQVRPQALLGPVGNGTSVPPGIAAVVSLVSSPAAKAALEKALLAVQADPGSMSQKDLEALVAALQKVPTKERGPVIKAVLDRGLFAKLAAALRQDHIPDKPARNPALQAFYSLLLANAPAALLSRITKTFPNAETPLDHPNLWHGHGFKVRYEKIKNPLFHKGGKLLAGDIWQGALNDCYFMSALLTIARKDPGFLKQHMHDNGNGTVTVTFYVDGKPVQVTVTEDIPTRYGSKTPIENGQGAGSYAHASHVSWVEIYEKAYAQLRGGYGVINVPYDPAKAFQTLTGSTPTQLGSPSQLSLAQLQQQLAAGHGVIVGTDLKTHGLDGQPTLVKDHDYVVESVNAANGTVVLRNPDDGGQQTQTVSWADVQAQGDYAIATTVP